MALTVDNFIRFSNANKKEVICQVDFDDSAPQGGESLTARDLGLRVVEHIAVEPRLGYTFEYDYANAKLIVNGATSPRHTMVLTDDDDAASTGVALYVHIDEVLEQGSYLAHLEAVTAGNADSYFALFSGGPHVRVQDDDNAASTGLALYFDEDATLGSRLLADLDNVGDADVFLMASDGSRIRIDDTDTPGTPGVQVYFDDDAANAYERVLFVSPTNTDGTEQTGGEVKAATNLSHLTGVRVRAIGHN